jgi:hypothetical protein
VRISGSASPKGCRKCVPPRRSARAEFRFETTVTAWNGERSGSEQAALRPPSRACEAQVADFELLDGVDAAFKLLALLEHTHPFYTVRAAELMGWGASPAYQAIRRGEYRRRSEQPGWVNPVPDIGGAAEHYAHQAKTFATELTRSTQKVAGQASTYARRVMGDALAPSATPPRT